MFRLACRCGRPAAPRIASRTSICICTKTGCCDFCAFGRQFHGDGGIAPIRSRCRIPEQSKRLARLSSTRSPAHRNMKSMAKASSAVSSAVCWTFPDRAAEQPNGRLTQAQMNKLIARVRQAERLPPDRSPRWPRPSACRKAGFPMSSSRRPARRRCNGSSANASTMPSGCSPKASLPLPISPPSSVFPIRRI